MILGSKISEITAIGFLKYDFGDHKILRKLLSVFSNMILGIQNSEKTFIDFLKYDFGIQNSEKTAFGFLNYDSQNR